MRLFNDDGTSFSRFLQEKWIKQYVIIAYDAHKACLRNKTSEETISIYLYQVVTVLYSESYIFNTISMFYQVISNLCSRRRTDYTVRKTIEYQESTILIYRPKSYLYYQDSRQSWRHTLSTINRYWYKHWVQIKLARVLQNVLNVHSIRNEENGQE